jgi:hypothetical protein
VRIRRQGALTYQFQRWGRAMHRWNSRTLPKALCLLVVVAGGSVVLVWAIMEGVWATVIGVGIMLGSGVSGVLILLGFDRRLMVELYLAQYRADGALHRIALRELVSGELQGISFVVSGLNTVQHSVTMQTVGILLPNGQEIRYDGVWPARFPRKVQSRDVYEWVIPAQQLVDELRAEGLGEAVTLRGFYRIDADKAIRSRPLALTLVLSPNRADTPLMHGG